MSRKPRASHLLILDFQRNSSWVSTRRAMKIRHRSKKRASPSLCKIRILLLGPKMEQVRLLHTLFQWSKGLMWRRTIFRDLFWCQQENLPCRLVWSSRSLENTKRSSVWFRLVEIRSKRIFTDSINQFTSSLPLPVEFSILRARTLPNSTSAKCSSLTKSTNCSLTTSRSSSPKFLISCRKIDKFHFSPQPILWQSRVSRKIMCQILSISIWWTS